MLEYIEELDAVVVGTAQRRGETRDRLIDAAITSFRTSGFTATSVRALADQVGITSAAVYSHFASKQDLLGVATAAAQVRFLRAVVVPVDPIDPPTARLDGLARRQLEYELRVYGRKSWFDLLFDNEDELGLLGPEHAARTLRMPDLQLAEIERAFEIAGARGGRLEAEVFKRICENTVAIRRSVGGEQAAFIEGALAVLRRIALPAGGAAALRRDDCHG